MAARLKPRPRSTRLQTRVAVVKRAFASRLVRPGLREAPNDPRRILIAHHLLFGDTLALTPLLAKLRANFPRAEIRMTVPKPIAPLYSSRPFGMKALPYDPRDVESVRAMFKEPAFDLALVPGDSRHSWLAAALGARHVIAHAGDTPATKNWFVDSTRPFRLTPATWGELAMDLIDGRSPAPYQPGDWTAPPVDDPPYFGGPYAVLHLRASTPLKHWRPERWAELARRLTKRGLNVVWSAGRDAEDQELVAQCDPESRYPSTAGRLDLPQLWHLLANAALLVSPDTGVAHLGRVTWTPSVVLFGPGSTVICGDNAFWHDTPWRSVTIPDFPCRDQQRLFRRDLPWVRACTRGTNSCAQPKCMEAISVDAVELAVEAVLAR